MADKKPQLLLVVGVGASTGGLEAFQRLLSVLPSDSGMAFLFAQHLDPIHPSRLDEVLAPHTKMTVMEAGQGKQLEPNEIYIVPPHTTLTVRRGKIELSESAPAHGVRRPIDRLFQTLAQEYGTRAVGIVMTGTGDDGSAGVRHVKASGGLTIAQTPALSGQAEMSQNAIDSGFVDLVLKIEDIPAALARFASLPDPAQLESAAGERDRRSAPLFKLNDSHIGRLTAALEARINFDLRVYKPATIERRVLRRMMLSGFEDINPYLKYLREDQAEQQTLVRDLLINVTEFFRDTDAFRSLRETVIYPLAAKLPVGAIVRAWIPGCATGEEAYSIGMELLDASDNYNKRLNVQIFATDIDQEALTFARTGIYPPAIASQVSPERLQKYFQQFDGKGYQVRPLLRDIMSFAAHDLTKDPPFSRMHLVSCRNVLIYLTAETQKHVLKVLHFALESDGYLFLSTSESTGAQRDLFTTISKSHRIYKKVGASYPIVMGHSRSALPREPEAPPPKDTNGSKRNAAGDLARRAVLETMVPPTVVVSGDGEVILAHGELSPYLRIPEGDYPRFELNAVLRPEIATRARGALYRCRRNKEQVATSSSPDGAANQVRISARPAPMLGDKAVILTFEDIAAQTVKPPPGEETSTQDAIVEQLEKELQATREDLRNTMEELETANEELRSSNEASTTMNEELQSSNEELEATTEELRSLNEELTTVNAQLREKVEQLEQAHDDLQNFFASTKIATIFLDEHLCIKSFTSVAREILGIDNADTGRFIGDIARELLQNNLEAEAKRVLEHLAPSSREIRTSDGHWVSRQVLPYRTESRRIEGVVVTFVDITELKLATERLQLREKQQSVVARIGLLALRENDLQGFMKHVAHEVQHTLSADYSKVLELQPSGEKLLLRAGVGWQPGRVGVATEDSGSGSPGGFALQSLEPVIIDDINTDKRFAIPSLFKEHGITSGLSCVIRDGDHRYGVIGAFTREHRAFTEEDIHFMQAVANVMGSTIGRYYGRMRSSLELSVAHVLAEAADLDEALDLLLERMAKEVNSATVAELWWWQAEENHLVRRCLHVALPEERRRVHQYFCGEDRYKAGQGLIGKVFDRLHAVWSSDLGSELPARADGAKHLGLTSALALPIRSGNEGLGVIVLFTSDHPFADKIYLHSLDAIGRSIGDFIAGWSADDKARQLGAITACSHDAIYSYRLDGTVTMWLLGAEELFGYGADEMVGQSVERIVPQARRSEFWSVNERILNAEVVEPFETERLHKDGSVVAVSERSSPIKNRRGAVEAISSIDRDISHMKESQRRLLEADRQKDEFIAMLGHELRNPLAAISSASELLKLRPDNEETVKRSQAIIQRQSTHMGKLLDGLLDVSRIIRGKIQLVKKVVDFADICRNVEADIGGRLGERRLELISDLPAKPVWVKGDSVRLTQIVDNLVSNAIKYTGDGGKVSIILRREQHFAKLQVCDTGVGIEVDLLPYVFDVFRQSHQNLDRSRGGLGLGLALVKSLVELHDGSVQANSEGESKGSEFTVKLPLTEERPRSRQNTSKREGSMCILVIEDNEDSAATLQEVLESLGHRVLVATRARAGIALAREHSPDVVLCDLGLPDGMTGFDLAQQLRGDPTTQDMLLIALTGYGRPEDKERCKQAGFDLHLTKPVNLSTITQALNSLCVDESGV